MIYKSWCVIVGVRGERTHTSDSGEFAAIESLLNERTRRRWAAVEARALGRGGIARVAEATGLSRATISAGLQELAAGPQDDDAAGRLRGPGAGRKALAEHDADLVAALERLADPATRGDPTGPLRWTCSSAARLSRELQEAGHRVRGAALLRRRPNQSLRQRGRRQLDPSRRGEGAAEGTGGRWHLCRQRRLGVFRWYSRAWWRVSVRINAPAARGGLRTVATAAKCHRAPVDYHPVAGQMPTGLQ